MSVAEAGGDRVTWTYDNINQLINEHRSGSVSYNTSFTWDPLGNRLALNEAGQRTTSAYDAANQLKFADDASGRSTYTFDADGNQQIVLAPNGDLTTYAWDYENQLLLVQESDGSRATMSYNADFRRVQKLG
jgi:YD repeat-containing protein